MEKVKLQGNIKNHYGNEDEGLYGNVIKGDNPSFCVNLKLDSKMII